MAIKSKISFFFHSGLLRLQLKREFPHVDIFFALYGIKSVLSLLLFHIDNKRPTWLIQRFDVFSAVQRTLSPFQYWQVLSSFESALIKLTNSALSSNVSKKIKATIFSNYFQHQCKIEFVAPTK